MIYHPTQFVSTPRSGHHWLVRCLKLNLPGWRYDEMYTTEPPHDLVTHCDARKSHDLDLRLPQWEGGVRYVIQVRRNVKALLKSWQRIAVESERDARWMTRFYHKFIRKWVLASYDGDARLVVWYEDLLADTPGTVRRVLGFVTDADWRGRDVKVEKSTK